MGLFPSRQRSAVTFDKQIPAQSTGDDAAAMEAARTLGALLEERRRGGARLGDVLLDQGQLSQEQLTEMLQKQSDSGKRLGALLVEVGMVPESAVTNALGSQLGLPMADLRRDTPSPEATRTLPESIARSLRALPMSFEDGELIVAVEDPLSPSLLETLARSTGFPIRLHVAVPDELKTALNAAYRTGGAIDELVDELHTTNTARAALEAPRVDAQDADGPVVQIVNLIITQAVRDRASDVHIEPAANGVRVRNRIDGALHEDKTIPLSLSAAIVSRIKVLAGMNIIEKRAPQDGQIKFTVDGAAIDLRVSTTPVLLGEKVVLRVLDKAQSTRSLSDLGMPPELHERFSELAHAPFGMVLCAGPTGSGKTTTLYATLNEVATSEVNVMTIEDPVEYVVPTINQIQIHEPSGLTFASGLRSILRQDPDVILVGEIRDVETAGIAAQAALTGHFVLSSVHATDAASALHRFIDMGIEPFLITSSVLAVVGQRLVRRICNHCKEAYVPSDQDMALYQKMGGAIKHMFYRGVGCNLCAMTGYSERVGIYEVLTLTEEIRNLVTVSASREDIRSKAIEQGMVPLRNEALRLIEEDQTTITEVVRTVYPL